MEKTILYYSLVSWSVFLLSGVDVLAKAEPSSFQGDGINVLLLTMEEAGHSIPMLSLGEALMNRGHKVTLLAVEIYQPARTGTNKTMTNLRTWCWERGVKFVSAGILRLDLPSRPEDFEEGAFNFVGMIYRVISAMVEIHDAMWKAVVEDELDLLQSADVVVLDVYLCHLLEWLDRNTNLTVLSMTQSIPFSSSSLPSWYYPSFASNPSRDPNPSITDRFVSVVTIAVFDVIYNTRTVGVGLKKLLPVDSKSGIVVPDIAATSFGFDYPRPLYPMMHFVGPIVSSREETIGVELATWLQKHSTPHSVVYFSMGSWAPVSGSAARAVVHGAMESGYDLLWSLKNDSRAMLASIDADYVNSSRVFISSWLPQASVLKHPSISLAVLHGGLGGVNEALLSGIPIICLPLGGDQIMNCGRVQHQQLGIDFGVSHQLSVSDIKTAIQKIKDFNCREKKNAQKMSKIFKKAGGASKAVELID